MKEHTSFCGRNFHCPCRLLNPILFLVNPSSVQFLPPHKLCCTLFNVSSWACTSKNCWHKSEVGRVCFPNRGQDLGHAIATIFNPSWCFSVPCSSLRPLLTPFYSLPDLSAALPASAGGWCFTWKMGAWPPHVSTLPKWPPKCCVLHWQPFLTMELTFADTKVHIQQDRAIIWANLHSTVRTQSI